MSFKEFEQSQSQLPVNSEIDIALEKHRDLPELAIWKALITQHGVDLDNPYLFNNVEGINKYKVKYRILKPKAEKFGVYDLSSDPTIIPSEVIIFQDQKSSIVKLGFRENSPLLIDIDDEKGVCLRKKTDGEIIPLQLSLVKKRGYEQKRLPEDIDPAQPKLSAYVGIAGTDRFSVMPFDGCWNWTTGNPCHFCDLNPKRRDFVSTNPTLNTLKDYDMNVNAWWNSQRENYLKGLKYSWQYILDHEEPSPHRHLLIMSGNLPSLEKVWEAASDVIGTLNQVGRVSDFDNYLNICPHPSIPHLERMKTIGIRQVQFNLEVIGKDNFSRFCPGKGDYNLFKHKLEEAVSVMGFGNVRSNFVLGLQPMEELLDGIKDLAQKGVVADYSIFQPKRGTPLAKHPAPNIDIIADFTRELVEVYRKYGFKGIYCNMSSRSSIVNECLC